MTSVARSAGLQISSKKGHRPSRWGFVNSSANSVTGLVGRQVITSPKPARMKREFCQRVRNWWQMISTARFAGLQNRNETRREPSHRGFVNGSANSVTGLVGRQVITPPKPARMKREFCQRVRNWWQMISTARFAGLQNHNETRREPSHRGFVNRSANSVTGPDGAPGNHTRLEPEGMKREFCQCVRNSTEVG